MLEALANPHRLQIIALLCDRRIHVSQLAREVRISRPLLYLHLKRLEQAGLVTSKSYIGKNDVRLLVTVNRQSYLVYRLGELYLAECKYLLELCSFIGVYLLLSGKTT